MPLIKGYSKRSIRKNIKREIKQGKPPRVAAAIAYKTAKKACRKKMSARKCGARLRRKPKRVNPAKSIRARKRTAEHEMKMAKRKSRKGKKKSSRRSAPKAVVVVNPAKKKRRRKSHAKRRNPVVVNPRRRRRHHAKKHNPTHHKRRRHHRRKNPGIGGTLLNLGIGTVGALVSGVAGWGIGKIGVSPGYQALIKAGAGLAGGIPIAMVSPAAGIGFAGGLEVQAAIQGAGAMSAPSSTTQAQALVNDQNAMGAVALRRRLLAADNQYGKVEDVGNVSDDMGALELQMGAIMRNMGAVRDAA